MYDKQYAILNTQDNKFWDAQPSTDVEAVKAKAAKLNAAVKPAFQCYTVVTVVFDMEV